VLSLGEQQLFSIARVVLAAPRFVFLERPRAALGAEHVDRILRLLQDRSITYLTLGDVGDRPDDHDIVLELADDGGWTWKAVGAGQEAIISNPVRVPPVSDG
jgi:vitamin B12/bleomycin/antimicrobial peptide transport system ATP-binding/permease protein